MPDRTFAKIASIAGTEMRFRLRTTAIVAAWLIVAASVYIIIPDPRYGWALMRISGMRCVYNSAEVALGTGVFCSLILSLAGYYLVSNVLRRDILSRTGVIIGSTPVTNVEYIGGKFIGNTVYLATIPLACMISAMLMFLLRGEGTLEPLVFFSTYAWLTIPIVLFCPAIALAFESLPALSGRFGDLVYFLIWTAIVGFSTSAMATAPGLRWTSLLDVTGLSVVYQHLHELFHTEEITIGGATIDPSLPTIYFRGIAWSGRILLQRGIILILPALFTGLAALWFHRFDTSRITTGTQRGKRKIVSSVNRMLKPLTRVLWKYTPFRRKDTLAQAVTADVIATLTSSPLTALGVIGCALACVSSGPDSMSHAVLPVVFFVLTFALADIAVRDSDAGTLTLLFTAPRLRERYVLWKFLSTLAVTLMFTLIPMVRLMAGTPGPGLSLLIGTCLVSAGAASFGVLTRSPKLFIGLTLMLLYVSLNSHEVPALDYAGFNLRATPTVRLAYALLSAALLAVAAMRHRSNLART